MIILLHGDNLVASRNFLTSLKKKYSQIQNFSVKNINDLIDHLMIQGLFVTQELIVIEGFSKELLERIKGIQTNKDIVIWSEKTVNSPPLDVKVLEFKGNFKGNAFKWADYVALKDLKSSLEMLGALKKEKVPFEILVGTLFRQFKLLITFKEREPLSVPDFVKEKIKRQSSLWEIEELSGALKLLLGLDEKVKTGKIEAFIGLNQFIFKIASL